MKKKNLMKSLTALVLSVLMVLSLAACGAKPSDGGKDEDKDGYTVAIIKQMDHASLDEIADAIAARLDAIAQEQNVSIRYTITSGQGDQSVLKQLADQAVADKVDAIIPIARCPPWRLRTAGRRWCMPPSPIPIPPSSPASTMLPAPAMR